MRARTPMDLRLTIREGRLALGRDQAELDLYLDRILFAEALAAIVAPSS